MADHKTDNGAWRGRASMTPRGDGSASHQRDAAPGTFGVVPVRAACDRRLGQVTPLHVLVVLGMYRNTMTGECYPSVGTIAAHLGITRRSVQRHLDSLVEFGHLVIVPQKRIKGGGQASNRYVLLFTPLEGLENPPPDAIAMEGGHSPTAAEENATSGHQNGIESGATHPVAADSSAATHGVAAVGETMGTTPERCDTSWQALRQDVSHPLRQDVSHELPILNGLKRIGLKPRARKILEAERQDAPSPSMPADTVEALTPSHARRREASSASLRKRPHPVDPLQPVVALLTGPPDGLDRAEAFDREKGAKLAIWQWQGDLETAGVRGHDADRVILAAAERVAEMGAEDPGSAIAGIVTQAVAARLENAVA